MSQREERQKQRQQPPQAPPPFETTKAEHYRYVYSSGVYGGVNPKDAHLIFFLNRLEPESVQGRPGSMRTAKVNQELQVEVHMSPVEFKRVAGFMASRIKLYEDQFGEIPTGPPDEDKEENPLVQ